MAEKKIGGKTRFENLLKTTIPFALVGYEVIITNSRYALVAGFVTSYPTRAHGIIAFTHLSNKINKTNFLQWAGLRHSIPSQLRYADVPLSTLSPSFTFKNNTFDIRQKRSKDYYSLLVSRKAQHPNITIKLQRDFDFTIDQINQIFLLPHCVALESYVKAFQYKVINSIFYTNTKLCKIGYRNNDLCKFYKTEPETSNHFFL